MNQLQNVLSLFQRYDFILLLTIRTKAGNEYKGNPTEPKPNKTKTQQNQTTADGGFLKMSSIPQQDLSHCSCGTVPCLSLLSATLLLLYLNRTRPLWCIFADNPKETLQTMHLNPTQAAQRGCNSGQQHFYYLQPPCAVAACLSG